MPKHAASPNSKSNAEFKALSHADQDRAERLYYKLQAAGKDPTVFEQCGYCLASNARMRCLACLRSYCDRKCQLNDWPNHKYVCPMGTRFKRHPRWGQKRHPEQPDRSPQSKRKRHPEQPDRSPQSKPVSSDTIHLQ